ncbi:protein trichome birefringence [Trifolium repens]|nr:protein trichome birefringence [Trifolium repens]
MFQSGPYKLLFQIKTRLQSVKNSPITNYGLSLTSLAEVCSHNHDYEFLVDVICLMTEISAEREYIRDGKITKMVIVELTDARYPLYSRDSCPFIDEGFDCEGNGRLDRNNTKWRWQPQDCDLPRFNATKMLELIRGKRLVFVGDSINRNQWESMLCMLLSALKDPKRVYEARGRKITKEKGNYSFSTLVVTLQNQSRSYSNHQDNHNTVVLGIPSVESTLRETKAQFNSAHGRRKRSSTVYAFKFCCSTSIMSSTSCRSACRSRSNSLTLIHLCRCFETIMWLTNPSLEVQGTIRSGCRIIWCHLQPKKGQTRMQLSITYYDQISRYEGNCLVVIILFLPRYSIKS